MTWRQELRCMTWIVKRVRKLSPAGQVWLRDFLVAEVPLARIDGCPPINEGG